MKASLTALTHISIGIFHVCCDNVSGNIALLYYAHLSLYLSDYIWHSESTKKNANRQKRKPVLKKSWRLCEDDSRRKKIGLKEGREGRRKWEEGRRIWRGHKSLCTVNVATHESPTFLISSGWETEVVSWRGNMWWGGWEGQRKHWSKQGSEELWSKLCHWKSMTVSRSFNYRLFG